MLGIFLKIMQRRKSNLTQPHGPIISNNCVYKTNSSTRTNFQSASFVCSGNNTEEYIEGSAIKNSSTQTSKTIIALPPVDTGQMSPDSLSPKTEYKIYSEKSIVNQLLDNNNTNLPYTRKQYVLKAVGDHPDGDFLTGDTLTKTFLEKTRNKKNSASSTKSPEVSTRSKFLQQTSPLRNIAGTSMKSKSYIESVKSDSPVFESSSARARFKVKAIKEKQQKTDEIKPVRYFCANVLNHVHTSRSRSPKCVSFMSPTIASKIKSHERQIENLKNRISPLRRGRSASPKKVNEQNGSPQHVPYIDNSSSTIRTHVGNNVDTECSAGVTLVIETDSEKNKPSARSQDVNTETTQGSYSDLTHAMNKVKAPDWNVALLGLADILEICRVCDVEFIYPHMPVINQRVIELLKSSRSHVCRTACQAVGHLFEYVRDTRRPEFDEIVNVLLCKTADSNKFIRHDANLALDCMVTHIPLQHSVRVLCAKGPDHKNTLVRVATARLVVCAVILAGAASVMQSSSSEFTRRRLILNMVRFLNDKTYETRKFGIRLYKLFSKEQNFDRYLKRYLEKDVLQQVRGCMKTRIRK